MEHDFIELLKDLVRIDTTNPPGNERKALEYLKNILEGAGIGAKIYESAPGRGNLLACLPADSPSGERPVILLSHIDVVLAREEQWSHPPFAAEEEDGYIYGRGTVDTKQLTVMELAAFLALAKSGRARRRDVCFLVTCDEESGSAFGLLHFLDQSISVGGRTMTGKELFWRSDVISEGGGFPISVGERLFYLCESGQKGCGTVEFTVDARLAKGPFFGSGDGVCRAMKLAGDIGSARLEQKKLSTVKRFEETLSACVDGEVRDALSPVMSNILTAMNRNTMTVTMIEGKNGNRVKVTCDVRLLPGFGEAYLKEVTDRLAEKWDAECRIVSFSEGYESRTEGGLAECLEDATKACLGDEGERAAFLPFISMGSSDGRFLVPMEARVYGYSPVLAWDMTFDTAVSMVHGTDERIHRDSVLFGCRVLQEALMQAVTGKDE